MFMYQVFVINLLFNIDMENKCKNACYINIPRSNQYRCLPVS